MNTANSIDEGMLADTGIALQHALSTVAPNIRANDKTGTMDGQNEAF